MPENIGDLVGRAGRIDADRHRPDHAGTELGDHPFGAVLAEDADMPAFAEAERA